ERTHACLGAFERFACSGQLLLHANALLQGGLELFGQLLQRRFALLELPNELFAPALQLLQLLPQAVEARRYGAQGGSLRFHADRDFLRPIAIALRLRAFGREILPQLVAAPLQLDARRFELRHRIETFLQARLGLRDRGRDLLVIAVDLLHLGADPASAFGGLFSLGAQRADLCAQLAVQAM